MTPTAPAPAELPANPPAFARPTSCAPSQLEMTLRDYFVAAALTGYIAGHAGDAEITAAGADDGLARAGRRSFRSG